MILLNTSWWPIFHGQILNEKITKNIFSLKFLLSKRFFVLCNVRNWLEIFMKSYEASLITKRHCEGDIVEHKVVANFPWTDSTVQNGRKKSIIFEKLWIIQTVYNVYIADHICKVSKVYEYSRQMQVANKVSCHRREKICWWWRLPNWGSGSSRGNGGGGGIECNGNNSSSSRSAFGGHGISSMAAAVAVMEAGAAEVAVIMITDRTSLIP